MKLLEITEQKPWDAFMQSQPGSQFTQSWDWGEFRVSRGQRIHRFAMELDGTWLAAALIVHFPKRFLGGYWYAPRGPLIASSLERGKALQDFSGQIRTCRVLENGFFLRMEPPYAATELPSMPKGFVPAHEYMPASTLLVDLSASEDALLASMHEKTRYNIRLAAKKGVTVREGTEDDIDTFIRLNEETATRDRFRPLSSPYLRETFHFLHPRGMASLRLAERGGEALAASMEMRFGDTVTYLHGASSSSQRNLMAPYALHWGAMRSAKVSGYRLYDFHGINPSEHASPYYKASWEGITRFKLGFGGERMDFVGTWELPKHPFLYSILRTLSRTHL